MTTRREAIKAMIARFNGKAQLELPLPIYPDRVMIREIGDRDIQELVQEMREDMEGLTSYEPIETLGGIKVHLVARRNAEIEWGRVTRADNLIYLEGWWERPKIEADFDPKVSER